MAAGDWFASVGSPASDKNLIRPLVDGERAWEDVLKEIGRAKKSINLAFWMMHLDHELERDATYEFKDPSDRKRFTLHDILIKKVEEGVKVRILLWILPTIPTTEAEWINMLLPGPTKIITNTIRVTSILALLDLRILQLALLRKFDVILEPHPTKTIGSWHQKTITIDNNVAFVGGMNARENDWDSFHAVYDYRRMPHSSSGKKRRSLESSKKEPKFPPRHDFQARIEGPLVNDIHNNFVSRWNQGIADKRFYTSKLSKLATSSFPSQGAHSTTGQIVRTMPAYPATPLGEKGCFEIYTKAIRKAKQYIYIENQYFRSPTISQELANAARKNPKLIVIVVTLPDMLAVSEALGFGLASPSTYWTDKALQTLEKAIPNWHPFKLMVSDVDAAGDRIYVDVDTHAKLMIIDDAWYTIGSCNVNERGFIYEGEMNVAAVDSKEAHRLRKRVWNEHLQMKTPNDIGKATKLWYDHARKNLDAMKKKRKPLSHVYAFSQNGPLLPMVPKSWV